MHKWQWQSGIAATGPQFVGRIIVSQPTRWEIFRDAARREFNVAVPALGVTILMAVAMYVAGLI